MFFKPFWMPAFAGMTAFLAEANFEIGSSLFGYLVNQTNQRNKTNQTIHPRRRIGDVREPPGRAS